MALMNELIQQKHLQVTCAKPGEEGRPDGDNRTEASPLPQEFNHLIKKSEMNALKPDILLMNKLFDQIKI